MPTYFARSAGNVNGSIWSLTPAGTASGYFPFTSSDILVANNFTVTLNVNTLVSGVLTDNTGGATVGGGFVLNDGVSLSGNVGSTLTGAGSYTLNYAGSTSANIFGNIFGGAGNGQVTILHNGVGTLNIYGNIGSIPTFTNAATVRLSSVNGICNLYGNISGIGGGSSCAGIWLNANNTICNISGNVTAGNVGGGVNSPAVYLATTSMANITGTVTGGNNGSAGVYNAAGGTVNISGTAIGGINGPGVTNISVGVINLLRAKGNNFGIGSVGLSASVGAAGTNIGAINIQQLEFGSLGQSPVSGPFFIIPSTGNIAIFNKGSGLPTKTLISTDSTLNVFPSGRDVRKNVVYGSNNYVGTMTVAGAANVASGVAVDNTVGTAILTTGNLLTVWDQQISAITASGSIGERLKNCSTVATVGQQLAAALTSVQ